MNERIKKLAELAVRDETDSFYIDMYNDKFAEKFAKLIISEVLDEVNERAYYCGDRAWSDNLDRKWIELEFGFGELADIQNERKNQRTR